MARRAACRRACIGCVDTSRGASRTRRWSEEAESVERRLGRDAASALGADEPLDVLGRWERFRGHHQAPQLPLGLGARQALARSLWAHGAELALHALAADSPAAVPVAGALIQGAAAKPAPRARSENETAVTARWVCAPRTARRRCFPAPCVPWSTAAPGLGGLIVGGGVQGSGMVPTTLVPRPGAERMSSVPPTASMRSRMLASP
jgi:hypothetical protein